MSGKPRALLSVVRLTVWGLAGSALIHDAKLKSNQAPNPFRMFFGAFATSATKALAVYGASDPRTPNPAILAITKLSHPMRPVARPVGWLNAHVGVSAHYFKASSPHIPAIHQPQTISSRIRHWWTQSILHTDTFGLRWTRAAAAILPEQILEALNASLLYGGQNGGI